MRKTCCILAIILLPFISHAEPHNLAVLKQQLSHYYDTGEYYDDISNIEKKALSYLRFRINQNKHATHKCKLAIVLDIDETSLSNYNNMRKLSFGGTKEEIYTDIDKGNDPAIPFTHTLYSYAINHGVAVFFVTGRKEKFRTSTVKNLKNVGFATYKNLYMEPNNYNKSSAVPYKVAMRKKIIKDGYDIVVNIGDQYSDLQGGLADMAFKLPNPFYIVQ